ncbi:exportin 7 [Anaeramoeba flamelloides]|uniref:Exportin 7 n=1 Tax=Anaeramoeba flamelloides TaxID=1746091 RepID=A0ABQ8ZBT6_9EUKA|nr:exportin 7 [Anaeramoeba flamelloides]
MNDVEEFSKLAHLFYTTQDPKERSECETIFLSILESIDNIQTLQVFIEQSGNDHAVLLSIQLLSELISNQWTILDKKIINEIIVWLIEVVETIYLNSSDQIIKSLSFFFSRLVYFSWIDNLTANEKMIKNTIIPKFIKLDLDNNNNLNNGIQGYGTRMEYKRCLNKIGIQLLISLVTEFTNPVEKDRIISSVQLIKILVSFRDHSLLEIYCCATQHLIKYCKLINENKNVNRETLINELNLGLWVRLVDKIFSFKFSNIQLGLYENENQELYENCDLNTSAFIIPITWKKRFQPQKMAKVLIIINQNFGDTCPTFQSHVFSSLINLARIRKSGFLKTKDRNDFVKTLLLGNISILKGMDLHYFFSNLQLLRHLISFNRTIFSSVGIDELKRSNYCEKWLTLFSNLTLDILQTKELQFDLNYDRLLEVTYSLSQFWRSIIFIIPELPQISQLKKLIINLISPIFYSLLEFYMQCTHIDNDILIKDQIFKKEICSLIHFIDFILNYSFDNFLIFIEKSFQINSKDHKIVIPILLTIFGSFIVYNSKKLPSDFNPEENEGCTELLISKIINKIFLFITQNYETENNNNNDNNDNNNNFNNNNNNNNFNFNFNNNNFNNNNKKINNIFEISIMDFFYSFTKTYLITELTTFSNFFQYLSRENSKITNQNIALELILNVILNNITIENNKLINTEKIYYSSLDLLKYIVENHYSRNLFYEFEYIFEKLVLINQTFIPFKNENDNNNIALENYFSKKKYFYKIIKKFSEIISIIIFNYPFEKNFFLKINNYFFFENHFLLLSKHINNFKNKNITENIHLINYNNFIKLNDFIEISIILFHQLIGICHNFNEIENFINFFYWIHPKKINLLVTAFNILKPHSAEIIIQFFKFCDQVLYCANQCKENFDKKFLLLKPMNVLTTNKNNKKKKGMNFHYNDEIEIQKKFSICCIKFTNIIGHILKEYVFELKVTLNDLNKKENLFAIKIIYLSQEILKNIFNNQDIKIGVFQAYQDTFIIEILSFLLKFYNENELKPLDNYPKIATSYFSLLESISNNNLHFFLTKLQENDLLLIFQQLYHGLLLFNFNDINYQKCCLILEKILYYYFKSKMVETQFILNNNKKSLITKFNKLIEDVITLFENILDHFFTSIFTKPTYPIKHISNSLLAIILICPKQYQQLLENIRLSIKNEKLILVNTNFEILLKNIKPNLKKENKQDFLSNLKIFRYNVWDNSLFF